MHAPLTLTIGAIYGVTGLVGKDYDMPVAVLSAISLGIAVDFAIHFLERARQLQRETGSWERPCPMSSANRPWPSPATC